MVGWLDGWLEKAEIKPTQPSWSWSWAELVNFKFESYGPMPNFVLVISKNLRRLGPYYHSLAIIRIKVISVQSIDFELD